MLVSVSISLSVVGIAGGSLYVGSGGGSVCGGGGGGGGISSVYASVALDRVYWVGGPALPVQVLPHLHFALKCQILMFITPRYRTGETDRQRGEREREREMKKTYTSARNAFRTPFTL